MIDIIFVSFNRESYLLTYFDIFALFNQQMGVFLYIL